MPRRFGIVDIRDAQVRVHPTYDSEPANRRRPETHAIGKQGTPFADRPERSVQFATP